MKRIKCAKRSTLFTDVSFLHDEDAAGAADAPAATTVPTLGVQLAGPSSILILHAVAVVGGAFSRQIGVAQVIALPMVALINTGLVVRLVVMIEVLLVGGVK
jgi:hypothetical protein